jgi:DNA repair exonuclease SbcCD ATPase subunit
MGNEISELRGAAPAPIDTIALKKVQQDLVDEIKSLNDSINQISVDIGKQQFKIEENNRRIEELKKLVGSVAPQKLAIEAFMTLASAFGRDGIPQMLVEKTIPRFEEIMNELVSEFECGFEIKVISQKQTKKGSMEDVIEILVNEGFGPREIRTFSGGENKLLKYLVRIAFAIIQAERSGKGLKVLVLDEAVDALDDDKTNDFMTMIMSLPKYFNQVFVISHNARILSDIPCKIKFERVSLAHPSKATVTTPGS